MTLRSMTVPAFLRRRSECGAAVFVVVLVIALLSALGVFAVRSTSTAVAASGYNRQLMQTHYVADLGIMASLTYAGDNPEAVKKVMMQGPDVGAGDASCVGFTQQTTPTCMLLSYDDIDGRVQASTTGNGELIDEMGRTPHAGVQGLEADFRIEMSDLHPALPVAGHEIAGGSGAASRLRYARVTVTANGVVRPQQQTAGTWDTQAAGAAGVEMSRAHIIVGPVTF